MSRQKLAAARELIREKHYAEARALLKTIDHPTARKWLAKLDEIAPEARSSQGGKSHRILLVVVVLVIVAGLLGFLAFRSWQRDGTARVRLYSYCLDIVDIDTMDRCWDWSETAFDAYRETVLACYDQSPVLDTPFQQCVIAENILPPGVIRR